MKKIICSGTKLFHCLLMRDTGFYLSPTPLRVPELNCALIADKTFENGHLLLMFRDLL